MPLPKSISARRYYRCAYQRHEEAQVLLRAEYTTGAVHLAGYGVECVLKALLLDVLRSFRGVRAHEFGWLRSRYLTSGGTRFPADVARHFTLVNDWSTDLRYAPSTIRSPEAEEFLASVRVIIRWADGRC